MTRPASHRDQWPEKCCENCKHCNEILWKHDDLCFHGDVIELSKHGHANFQDRRLAVETINGEDAVLLDGDAYDRIWSGRVVDRSDICNNWEPRV